MLELTKLLIDKQNELNNYINIGILLIWILYK